MTNTRTQAAPRSREVVRLSLLRTRITFIPRIQWIQWRRKLISRIMSRIVIACIFIGCFTWIDSGAERERITRVKGERREKGGPLLFRAVRGIARVIFLQKFSDIYHTVGKYGIRFNIPRGEPVRRFCLAGLMEILVLNIQTQLYSRFARK